MDVPFGAVSWRWLPNSLTVLRMLIVPPVVAVLAASQYSTGLVLILVAGATDVLDGYIARRFGWKTWLGSVLDPLADKLLVLTVYVTLTWLGFVPVWITALVVGRDAVIVTGASVYRYLFGSYEMTPTLLSKANSGLQLLFAGLVVAKLADLAIPDALLQVLLWLVALMTVASGVHYVWLWGNKAASEGGRQP